MRQPRSAARHWQPPPAPPPFPSVEDSDYVHKLVGSTLVPLGIVVLVLLGELAYMLLRRGQIAGTGIKYTIMMLFFLLPTTCSIIMATFATKEFYKGVDDSGHDLGTDSYMAVDLSIPAKGARYKFIMSYVWIMIAVYVGGAEGAAASPNSTHPPIPPTPPTPPSTRSHRRPAAGLALRPIITHARPQTHARPSPRYPVGVTSALHMLLWRKRHKIETRANRSGGPELKSLAFLFRLYSRR